MKKYLPFILLGVGALILVVVFIVVKTRSSVTTAPVAEEEETVPQITSDKLPFVSLTPTSDGHYLKLSVKDIKVDNVASLDYELLYKVKDGRTQGVPGTVALKGQTEFDRDILMGSESSGKFRYDDGVETGTLTIRFRDTKGKTLGKLSTDFHLLTATKSLTSVDGKFEYTLASSSKSYFVVMSSFGPSYPTQQQVKDGPYAVFVSDTKSYPGEVKLSGTVSQYNSQWTPMTSSKASNVGVFIAF